jgi:rod shape determining protein RodA
VLLLAAVASVGFLMLYSVAGGNIDTVGRPQMERFAVGMALMFAVAMVPIWFWRNMSVVAYIVCVAAAGGGRIHRPHVGMGAQRWIDLGPIDLQPSEMMKFALVMLLAPITTGWTRKRCRARSGC